MLKDDVLRAGELVMFSVGYYSDYRITGTYHVEEDTPLLALSDEYRALLSKQEQYSCYGFQDWLERKGYISQLDMREIDLDIEED
jgi:hypothetical protein